MIGWPGVRGVASRLATRGQPRATVLLYHRVAQPELDPWSLAVTAAHFAEHMAVLRRHASVVPLSRIRAALDDRRAPRRIVAVTFDDGYSDNLDALPALEANDVPATIFVVAGMLGGCEMWWDRLTRLLLREGKLPEGLSLVLDGARCDWSLGEWASYDRQSFDRHRGWRAGTEPPSARHALYLELWRRLQPMRHDERDRVLAEIETWARGVTSANDARMVTREELAALGAHPLIDIGGHTVTHPKLSALDPSEQREEIVGGKRVLEEIVGTPVGSFAYPFGRPEDFTEETQRMVRDAGFALACANYSGTVRASANAYALPRAYVHDCDGDEFERSLSSWLDAPAR